MKPIKREDRPESLGDDNSKKKSRRDGSNSQKYSQSDPNIDSAIKVDDDIFFDAVVMDQSDKTDDPQFYKAIKFDQITKQDAQPVIEKDLRANNAETEKNDEKCDNASTASKVSTLPKDDDDDEKVDDQKALRIKWNEQEKKRRNGELKMLGGYVAPNNEAPASTRELIETLKRERQSKDKKIQKIHIGESCSKAVLQQTVEAFLANAYSQEKKQGQLFLPLSDRIRSLADIKYPCGYVKPTEALLAEAHAAQRMLLPDGDCDSLEVARIADAYRSYWKPDTVRVILLAESHSHTPLNRAKLNVMKPELIPEGYDGPLEFVQLVYCLTYGEDEALDKCKKKNKEEGEEKGANVAEGVGETTNGECNDEDEETTEDTEPFDNKGTPQFWTLLAAASRGLDFRPEGTKEGSVVSTFAADILKGGDLSVKERLKAKLQILQDLKNRGIWLIDTSVIGWYMPQTTEHVVSKNTNQVQKKAKARPPPTLLKPSMLLSYELYTKHLIREATNGGELRHLVLFGKRLLSSIGRNRLEQATNPNGLEKEPMCVVESFPAPNAFVRKSDGGYAVWHKRLYDIVNEAAPAQSDSKTEYNESNVA